MYDVIIGVSHKAFKRMKERHALLEHTAIYLSVQIQCTY